MPNFSTIPINLDDKLLAEFEEDPFVERLLKLRQSNRIAYLIYPQAVRDAVEEYEREKEAAETKRGLRFAPVKEAQP